MQAYNVQEQSQEGMTTSQSMTDLHSSNIDDYIINNNENTNNENKTETEYKIIKTKIIQKRQKAEKKNPSSPSIKLPR